MTSFGNLTNTKMTSTNNMNTNGCSNASNNTSNSNGHQQATPQTSANQRQYVSDDQLINDYFNRCEDNNQNIEDLLLNENFLGSNGNTSSNTDYQALKIKTKSIENALLPLVTQISTLVNFKENLKNSLKQQASAANQLKSSASAIFPERTVSALKRVGEAVNLAVGRFVSVGETIGYENPAIRLDMVEACREARNAGVAIKTHTQIPCSVINETIGQLNNNRNDNYSSFNDKFTLIQAANTLLNSVTKVLLLADVVIINQILNSKNKVLMTLNKLENVADFYSFVNVFTQYGNDLIELAHLSGERQNDLKDDKRRSQLSSSRWILEKSTAMILSSSKTYLKHMECECAKENISLVYSFLYYALDSLHYITVDSGTMFDCAGRINNNQNFKSSINQMSFMNAYRQFEDVLDLAKNNMITEVNNNLVISSLTCLISSIQDYTNSMYINNDQRERIIRLENEIREQILLCLREDKSKSSDQSAEDTSNNQCSSSNINRFNRLFDNSLILSDLEVLKKLLQAQTMQLANGLFRENKDARLLNMIKTYALSNDYDLLVDSLDKFREYSEQVLELCKLLRHISTIDVFEVTCEHHFNVFDHLSKMIQSAASTVALYPSCKSANENLNLFCSSWESQVNDLSILVKEMQDFLNGVKSSKSIYLSLPKPGKHGTSSRTSSFIVPTRLDSNEQAKILKLGLEMKLIQNEIDAEADKWNEPQNEIVKIAKLMSDMAYEIHLFTRGEGSLSTTQDLFSRAEVFLEHGALLYSIVKDFLSQVPNGILKQELVQLIERLPTNFKLLRSKLRQVTVGKKETFNKVDCVIQETRDFMNLTTKIVTNCFLCSTKYNINNAYESIQNDVLLNNNLQNLNINGPGSMTDENRIFTSVQSNQPTYAHLNANRYSTLSYTSNRSAQQQHQINNNYNNTSYLSNRLSMIDQYNSNIYADLASSSNYNQTHKPRASSLQRNSNYT